MRLKVVGERSSRFFPLLVAFLTSVEEFHSLKKTFNPWSSSQRFRRYIWVDLPEPSSPSTAIKRPGNPNSANVFIALPVLKTLPGKGKQNFSLYASGRVAVAVAAINWAT